MLSLAGEHLVVQICFMFHLLSWPVVCLGSGQHHPQGEWSSVSCPGTGPNSRWVPAHTTWRTQLGVELLYMWYILFRANLVNVSRGCCKCLGRGEIFCEFETHRRAGTGNHYESASFIYTVKNEHLGWSLPTDTRCHFEEHTDLNSPHGHTAHSVAQPPIDCCS